MLKRLFHYYWTPFIFASIVFLFFQLQIFNLGIGFRDEGFLYFNATRILSGEIPYKDFFSTTTPGSFYFLSFVLKLFGIGLIQSRIIYIVLVLIILALVNAIYKLIIRDKYIALITIAIFFLGPSAIASYNIYSLTFSLISFYLLMKGIGKNDARFIFLSGAAIGLTLIFKQSYGIWIGVGFLFILLHERLRKFGFRDVFILSYVAGVAFPTSLFLIYFYLNNSLSQLVYYSGVFSREVKAHRAPFILKSVVLIPFLYFAFKLLRLNVIRKFISSIRLILLTGAVVGFLIFENQIVSYLEFSRIYYAGLILVPVVSMALIKRSKSTTVLRYSAIYLLVLFLANASSGRELGVVMWVCPVLIPFILMLVEYFLKTQKAVNKQILYFLVILFVVGQALFFSHNSISSDPKVYANFIRSEMNYELDSPHARYIKVSKEQKNELDSIIGQIDELGTDKKLLCFPYCPMMNVLTQRESPSYFNFFYPEAFLISDQQNVIDELKKSDSIIVIQKKGKIEPEADREDRNFSVLRNYIIKNYNMSFETRNFTVYE